MLNIVIPMAGKGSRFVNAGYKVPKPMINVLGEPMISLVTKNIRPACDHRFIYICLAEHIRRYNLEEILDEAAPGCIVVSAERVTDGAACTVLLAEKYIDNDEPLMIANSDQYIDIDINTYLAGSQGKDGLIMTMTADDPKWSFIRYDKNNIVVQVKEKEVVSTEATVGIYNFAQGRDFVEGVHCMIDKNQRVNSEFYVAPVYNELISKGKKIYFYNIGMVGQGMYGLGTPEDLQRFLHKQGDK